MSDYDFDLITIGGGSGGVRAARFAASTYGAKVALVENMRLGGTCVMRGCVPKKFLVFGSRFADEFEDAVGYGWEKQSPGFTWQKLIKNKDLELDRLEGVYHRLLREANVTEINGTGKLIDAHTVEVDGQTFTAKYVLIATGGWPHLPNIPGIEHAITSNEALDLPELPKRMVIVGGGYIAVEFAGVFNSLGTEVTIILRGDQILRGFDTAIRGTLQGEMMKRGIKVLCETRVNSIEHSENGGFSLRLDQVIFCETDVVMYATGRRPNTKGIGLEEAGVALNDKGAVIVDENYKTTLDGVYAIGDVTDRIQLTPVALSEGMALASHLFGDHQGPIDYQNIPTAVFSQPEVGTVGLTEDEARHDYDIQIFQSRFRPMKHTLTGRDEQTMMKMIVDKKTDRVLGCHMVGPDAGEMMQGLGIALKAGATKAHFDATIGIHPTGAEEWVTMRTPLREHED